MTRIDANEIIRVDSYNSMTRTTKKRSSNDANKR